MKYLVILLVLVGFVGVIIPTSYGLCVSGTDWDDVPCWGRVCYDDSDEPACTDPDWWKERWEPYYDYKGKDWMESKKQELLDAIKSDSLTEWKKTTPNGTNHNVHDYYYYMGEVPNHYGVYVKQVFSDSIPPLKQIRAGTTIEDIFCKQNLVLLQKYDGSPACVKSDSFEKLYLRGWGDCVWNCSHPIPESIIEHSRKLAYMDKTMDVHGTDHSVKYRLDGNATVTDSIYSEDSASVIITLDAITAGSLTIELPRTLIDSGHSNCDPSYERDDSFAVLIDNVEVRFEEIVTTSEKRTLSISFQENTKKIEIVSFCLI